MHTYIRVVGNLKICDLKSHPKKIMCIKYAYNTFCENVSLHKDTQFEERKKDVATGSLFPQLRYNS
uniref:Uncharacterized protein n=1 Tax=Arion vulgaris TaxID=1028688 RepID=A0A0B7B8L6_9EUPU